VVRPTILAARGKSTTTAETNATASLPLSWPAYLSLRKQRRIWSTAFTIPTTLTGLTLGAGYFASIEADPTQLIMGIEPM
jgi:import inner membrane translocase subunit TIM23